MVHTAHRAAALIAAGARGLLQRVPRGTDASGFASALADETTRAVELIESFQAERQTDVAVLDLRGASPEIFAGWDASRPTLFTGEHPTVVLLDVLATRSVLRAAPQTASWLGGVLLPVEASVRPASTEEERAAGRAALARAFEAHPEFEAAHRGQTVGVDLFTEQLFAGRSNSTPLDRAQEELDEGVLYLTWLP